LKYIKRLMAVFWKGHRAIVRKNSRLKNCHAGETCMILGNGGSLKNFDLSKLPNLPAICTAYSLVDNRLKDVNVRYWVIPDSYVLYPVIMNHVEKKIAKNYLRPILKKIALNNRQVTLIHSLTHFYSFFPKTKDVVYYHHFGDKKSGSFDLAGDFATCAGSLHIMIGVARFLGFSKAILLGCDYLGSPKLEGHFYSDSAPVYGKDDSQHVDKVKGIAGDLDMTVILAEGSSCSAFKSASFEEYFGVPEVKKTNVEIIDEEYLAMMRKAAVKNQIYI